MNTCWTASPSASVLTSRRARTSACRRLTQVGCEDEARVLGLRGGWEGSRGGAADGVGSGECLEVCSWQRQLGGEALVKGT